MCALIEVVKQAAGTGNDDLDAAFQLIHLRIQANSSINGNALEPGPASQGCGRLRGFARPVREWGQ